MEPSIVGLLFSVLYGFQFNWVGTQMAKNITPLGVGQVFSEGIRKFIPRVLIVVLTIVFSACAFIYSIEFLLHTANTVNSHYMQIILICIVIALSYGPNSCYHLARLIMRPWVSKLDTWKGQQKENWLKNVDTIFLAAHILSLAFLWIIWTILQ